MVLQDVLDNRIVPFDVDDEKIKALFSYYLHKAPTIESASSGVVPPCGETAIWNKFLTDISIDNKEYQIYGATGYITAANLRTYDLESTSTINRKTRKFIMYRASFDITDLGCFLRHMRNSIAHSNVFMVVQANRKFLVFDDYNSYNHHTSRIVLGQTDLIKLRKLLGG